MKTLFPAIAIAYFFCSWTLFGEDKKFDKLLDYENVTVTKILPDRIKIMHSGGVTSILIEQLPESVRTELNLSEDRAEDFREEVAERRKAYLEKARKAKLRHKLGKAVGGEIIQVLPEGILVQTKMISGSPNKERYKKWETRTLVVRAKNGLPHSVGAKVPVQWEPDTTYFIYCDTDGLTDGKRFEFMEAFDAGTYRYSSVLGAKKTVLALTTDLDRHLELAAQEKE